MKKLRQILAILGILLLVGLYGLTLFAALFDPTETLSYLGASVAATILIPAVLWFIGMFMRMGKPKLPDEEMPERETDAKTDAASDAASLSDPPRGKDHDAGADQKDRKQDAPEDPV